MLNDVSFTEQLYAKINRDPSQPSAPSSGVLPEESSCQEGIVTFNVPLPVRRSPLGRPDTIGSAETYSKTGEKIQSHLLHSLLC